MSKTAVITGGTRGIGLETVRLFAENGYHVVFYGSRKETVDKALAQLDGLEVEGKWTDLTDEEAIRRDFRQIAETRGSLDVLINNAGISDRQPFLDYDLERFDRIMRLNVTAPYVCSQAAAVIMKDQGHGVILNTSSMVGPYGGCGLSCVQMGSQRHDKIPGTGAGTLQHSCQCSGAGCNSHRYGTGSSGRNGGADFAGHPSAACRGTLGYRPCIPVSGI